MVPLVVRSHYSLMWGTASPAALCRAARAMGYRRLALTDTDNLYGLWPFLAACRREGLTPIVGAEVTDPVRNHRAVCLVESESGYRNLCRLLTRRHMDGGFELADALEAFAEGLIVLTGNAELLVRCRAAGMDAAAALPRHPPGPTHPLRQAARRVGASLVAVPGSFFLRPEDFPLHRLLRAIAGNTGLSRLPKSETASPDAWLAPPDTYAERFAVCPEAVAQTEAMAERIGFHGPEFGRVLPPWTGVGGDSPEAELRKAAYAGARRRYGGDLPESVVDRLEHELSVIESNGFSAYFLVVRDIVALSPRICGRGSAAASIVAYCLGVTNVCPIKHNLYFERFLNPGRTDPPDIDVDFAWDERDAVQQTVLARYRDHAAMVCNHVRFQPRMAVRETAKVFGLAESEIGRVTRRLPWFWRMEHPDGGLLQTVKALPQARGLTFSDPWPEILRLAQALIDIPRHLSVHSGGVVVTPEPIDHYVPVERAAKGVPVIHWDKDAAEDAGLVKIDLLGNRSLGVIRDAAANIRSNGIRFDEMRWEPEDDFSTQEAVSQGRTMGCFYIESPAMRLLQQKAGVGDFEHLVIHSSIIRPAANEFIREYLRRLHGGRWDPIHPLLADVLTETFGIMVYQEDVSRAAVAVAGFSHAEADRLRKVLSKKDREYHLRDFRRRFTEGARGRGVPRETIDAVWSMIMSFSGYSFCKPHSASYARVSFQAAFLKTHYPAEFMAAVISNQGGFYSTSAYVSEARRMGLGILPPDVTVSGIRWRGEGDTLRVGLMAVSGLSRETRERILAARKARPFRGLKDFLDRVGPDEGEARAMIRCGALDRFSNRGDRTELLWGQARWRKTRSERQSEGLLFGRGRGDEGGLPVFPPEDPLERLRREFAVLGFLCDRHPMALYRKIIDARRTVKADGLHRWLGRQVRFAGWLVTGKVVHTRQGAPMEFLTFEDETGIVETTFFPEAYHRFCHLLNRNRPFLLTGRVEAEWGALTLTVNRVAPLPPLPADEDTKPGGLLLPYRQGKGGKPSDTARNAAEK
ncbi:MAG: DNA polymerase III subunit alpha [Desulfobacterales bacterium]